MFPGQVIIDAHEHCTNNRKELESSHKCGCFYCGRVFPASEVEETTIEFGHPDTVLCPYCGIDSVLADADWKDISPETSR